MTLRLTKPMSGGALTLPGSKSFSHRALIAAAFADAPTRLCGFTPSQDTDRTRAALAALGVGFAESDGCLTVVPTVCNSCFCKENVSFYASAPLAAPRGKSNPIEVPCGESDPIEVPCGENDPIEVPCGESGSTLRFLLPVLAALGVNASFSGCGALPRRPILPLLRILREHGAAVSADALPFALTGRVCGGDFCPPAGETSQFISGLLLAAPLMCGDCRVRVPAEAVSRPYIDLTLSVLEQFSVRFRNEAGFLVKETGARLRSPRVLTVPADLSAGAVFMAAGALCENVSLTGELADATASADRPDSAVFPALALFGAAVGVSADENRVFPNGSDVSADENRVFPNGSDVSADESRVFPNGSDASPDENGTPSETGRAAVLTVCGADRRPFDFSLIPCPDLFPTLAVLAAAAEGDSHFSGIARLAGKESDRVSDTAELLRALGGSCTVDGDRFTVHGNGRLTGGRIATADHRIAMAAALARSLTDGDVLLEGAECVAKSYPRFWNDFRLAGGDFTQ